MSIQYDGSDLTEFLHDRGVESITLIEPGGNHGDEIIYRGMRRLLERENISYNSINVYGNFETTHTNIVLKLYRRIQRKVNEIGTAIGKVPFKKIEDIDSDLILIHGGANVNEFWIHGIYLLNHLMRISGDTPVAVAPQTYFFKDRTISKAISSHKPVHMFCREKYSYSLLNREPGLHHINTYLSKDTAQYLSREDLTKYIDKNVGPDEKYTLLAFRDDKEAILSEQYKGQIERQETKTVTIDPSRKANFSFNEFVSYAENAETVHTDRLHVGILCSILEQDAIMYENLYYKNAGVYDLSLRDDPHVELKKVTEQFTVS